jgi:hypothetical protein
MRARTALKLRMPKVGTSEVRVGTRPARRPGTSWTTRLMMEPRRVLGKE